jgi:hypothetical protein
MASIWITAALTALVPLGFVIAPLVIELMSRRRRRHGMAGASRGTPRS